MVKPSKRRLKRKYKKVPTGIRTEYSKEKKGKANCAVTGKKLQGTHISTKGISSKKSKSQKRPSVPFGGVLNSPSREQVFEEAGKIESGVKNINDVEQKYRPFVKQAMKRIE